jgi:outer membrane protein insertion porin family
VYFNLLLRNLFGGAESLNTNASFGTRTKSSFSASFNTPILSNPNLLWEFGGTKSSTQKAWASHEEAISGGHTKLRWLTSTGDRHELGYSGTWRQITGLAENASPTVRGDAGDSFKSSITHSWINNRLDYPLLPSTGYYMKTVSELAGFGPLKGDVAFGKFEAEAQAAVPVPIPGIKGRSGIALTAGLRGGVLYPLTLAGADNPSQSQINDRFTLGGPSDVRGFRYAGIGPRVGGDVYAAGGASLLIPFPRVGAQRPLRLQAFVNGGRLLALKGTGGEKGMSSESVNDSVQNTIAELANGLPTISAGIGVVYALPVARLELNFSLPLVIRKGEEPRKGLSLGVGISFM